MQKESLRTRGSGGRYSRYFAGGFALRRCRNSIRRYSAAPKRESKSQFPLFPLNRRRGLRGDVVADAVGAGGLGHDAAGKAEATYFITAEKPEPGMQSVDPMWCNKGLINMLLEHTLTGTMYMISHWLQTPARQASFSWQLLNRRQRQNRLIGRRPVATTSARIRLASENEPHTMSHCQTKRLPPPETCLHPRGTPLSG